MNRKIDQELSFIEILEKVKKLSFIKNTKKMFKVNLIPSDILELKEISDYLEKKIISLFEKNDFKNSLVLFKKLESIKILDNDYLNVIYDIVSFNIKNKFIIKKLR